MEASRLAKIDVGSNTNPIDLFREWYDHAKLHVLEFSVRSFNIATVSNEGVVSNRTVLLQSFDEEGFVFNTSKLSRKHADIQNHPQVAICFNWITTSNGTHLSRQVRMEGIAKEMDLEYTQQRFRSASFRTKFRLAFCKQGNEIPWDQLKQRHEQFLKDSQDKDIEFPDTTVYYRVVPNRIEFYESLVDPITIADRVLFRKNEANNWYNVHVEA